MEVNDRPLAEVEVAVLDVETTGLSPPLGDRVVEIAVVSGRLDGEPRCWSTLIDPERPMAAEATLVNGITDEDLAGRPIFAKVLPELKRLLENRILVAHNAPFDLQFLHAEYARAGEEFEPGVVFDTLGLARRRYRYESNGLARVLLELGLQNHDPHRALGDARATFEVYRRFALDLPLDCPRVCDWLEAQGGPGFHQGPAAPELPADHPLLIALERNAGVRIRYTDGRGAITERSIVPLAISGIHLSAWCRLRETDRTFRVDRIEVIELERSS